MYFFTLLKIDHIIHKDLLSKVITICVHLTIFSNIFKRKKINKTSIIIPNLC